MKQFIDLTDTSMTSYGRNPARAHSWPVEPTALPSPSRGLKGSAEMTANEVRNAFRHSRGSGNPPVAIGATEVERSGNRAQSGPAPPCPDTNASGRARSPAAGRCERRARVGVRARAARSLSVHIGEGAGADGGAGAVTRGAVTLREGWRRRARGRAEPARAAAQLIYQRISKRRPTPGVDSPSRSSRSVASRFREKSSSPRRSGVKRHPSV